MLPHGIIVLSIDFHPLRHARRRFDTWWEGRGRSVPGRNKKKGPGG
jgi:hypothetical protein